MRVEEGAWLGLSWGEGLIWADRDREVLVVVVDRVVHYLKVLAHPWSEVT